MKHLARVYVADSHSRCGKKVAVQDLLGPENIDKVECEICLNMHHNRKKLEEDGILKKAPLSRIDLDFIKKPSKSKDDYKMLENQIELLKEDLECVHLYLDDIKAPKHNSKKEPYSIVGRIKALLQERADELWLGIAESGDKVLVEIYPVINGGYHYRNHLLTRDGDLGIMSIGSLDLEIMREFAKRYSVLSKWGCVTWEKLR